MSDNIAARLAVRVVDGTLSGMTIIKRRFADLPFGQVHYREAGEGAPILLIHGSPGSARQLTTLIGDLAADRYVIAPDTPGHGDSAPLPTDTPTIADYVPPVIALLDRLGLDRVDVYGTHTGGSIAAELAALAPARVGHLAIEGLGVFAPALQAELLERYARPFPPDLDGAYLMRAFHFLRDQYVFFPWYERSAAALRGAGLRSPAELHAWLVEILKSAETYHIAYRAAFAWDAAAALPCVTRPTLVLCSPSDPTFAGTQSVAALLPSGRFVELPRQDAADFATVRRDLLLDFFSRR